MDSRYDKVGTHVESRETTTPPRQWDRLLRPATDTWLLECLAMAMALLALGCVAIMLGLYNSQPLAAWSHVFSLNTVLSLLGSVMEGFALVVVSSCLGQLKWLSYLQRHRGLHKFELFDQASRGPWGSAKLLLSVGMGSLATVGALLMILALPSDAFVQQSVSYPTWNVSKPELAASVPFAQEFGHFTPGPFGDAGSVVLEPMTASIYDGVLNSNLSMSSSALQVTCPTGNCTSPPYVSLGVCVQCADVTDKLNYTLRFDPMGNDTIWTLPNGHRLANIETGLTFINITSSFVSENIGSPLTLNSDALNAYMSAGTISEHSIITFTEPSVDEPNPPADSAQALDCTMFICARSYVSSSVFHVFEENITHVFDQPQWNETEKQFVNGETQFTVASREVPGGVGNQSLTFTLNSTAALSLMQALGSVKGMVGTDSAATTVITSDIANGMYLNGYTNEAVNHTMGRVAQALSNAMRQTAGTKIPGTAYTSETHIVVQWLWLLLPLIVLLAAVALLLATIWKTRASGIPTWRTSALATMAYGVYGANNIGPTGYVAGHRKRRELENWARTVDVKLQRRTPGAMAFHLSTDRSTSMDV